MEPTAGTGTETLTRSVPTDGGHVHSVECECHPDPRRPKIGGETDRSPAIVLVPLVASEGRPFAVTEALAASLARDFPGVDVLQELRKLRRYALDLPRRRKTPDGIAKHVSYWMGRAQNEVGRRPGGAAGQGPGGAPSGTRQALDTLQSLRRPESDA